MISELSQDIDDGSSIVKTSFGFSPGFSPGITGTLINDEWIDPVG